jgi:hypothetical protein
MKAFVLGLAAAVLAATLLATLAVPLALALPVGPATGAPTGGSGATLLPAGQPPTGQLADIPSAMLTLYITSARRCPGLPWTVLAAIGKVETDHGRGPEVSPAGAEGPMQFMPGTWAEYGVDGDGDGVASIWDAADAVPSAADLLCANGGGDPARLSGAIFQYNHAGWYVQLVLDWAGVYARAPVGP